MLFAIAIICFLVASALGAWRQMCGFYEVKMQFNTPSAWDSRFIRIFSWLITTICSIAFSFIAASWIYYSYGEFIGKFSFGVFLFIRWLTSMLIGVYPAFNKHAAFEEKYLGKSIEMIDYEGLADSMMENWKDSGKFDISRDDLITLLKENAVDLSNNNLDKEEIRALDKFRKSQPN